jgi:hypothetical protein
MAWVVTAFRIANLFAMLVVMEWSIAALEC